MRESKIEHYFVAEVKKLRGEIRKIRWISRRGAPDRMVWIPGWLFPKMPEMKAPGKKLEAHQKREHKKLKKMGITCCKLDSYADVDRFLNV
jgi:hypothetical protein